MTIDNGDYAPNYLYRCHLDSHAYAMPIGRRLKSQGNLHNDGYHHDLFKNSHICATIDFGRLFTYDVANLVPNARSMDVSIGCMSDIDCLLAGHPSLTHLRIGWLSLDPFLDKRDPHRHPPSHPRHPRLYRLLSPNVTHLRLSTECFLKDIVPGVRKPEMLTPDAPPNHTGWTTF